MYRKLYEYLILGPCIYKRLNVPKYLLNQLSLLYKTSLQLYFLNHLQVYFDNKLNTVTITNQFIVMKVLICLVLSFLLFQAITAMTVAEVEPSEELECSHVFKSCDELEYSASEELVEFGDTKLSVTCLVKTVVKFLKCAVGGNIKKCIKELIVNVIPCLLPK